MSETIEHSGIVHEIENGLVKVNIIAQSACSACHAKSMCSVSDLKEKTIEVPLNSNVFNVGEQVNVLMKQNQGLLAVIYGYLLPFFVLIITLITLITITKNEVLAGIISISSLFPYYIGLYLLRNRIKKTFSFEIKKIQ